MSNRVAAAAFVILGDLGIVLWSEHGWSLARSVALFVTFIATAVIMVRGAERRL